MRSAHLTQAQISLAHMDRVDLSHANCAYSDLTRTNFQEANLASTNFCCANLREVNFEGADLTNCGCRFAQFGKTIRINAQTIIDRNHHMLIGMALLSQAETREQQLLALYIRHRTTRCWSEFTELLLWQSRDVVEWVKKVLMEIQSLRSEVEHYGGPDIFTSQKPR